MIEVLFFVSVLGLSSCYGNFLRPENCFLGDDILQQMALTAQWDVFLVMGHTLWTGMGACIEHTWTGIGACIGVGAGIGAV